MDSLIINMIPSMEFSPYQLKVLRASMTVGELLIL